MLKRHWLSLVLECFRGRPLSTPNLSKCKFIIATPPTILTYLITYFSSLLVLLVYRIVSLHQVLIVRCDFLWIQYCRFVGHQSWVKSYFPFSTIRLGCCITIIYFIRSVKLEWIVIKRGCYPVIGKVYIRLLLLLVFIVICNLLKRRAAMCIVNIQLSEACFCHHHIFKSSNEKLVFTRLQQKPKYHQNHAALGLKFSSNYHDLSIVEIFPNAY
jgi:hypothetical protein